MIRNKIVLLFTLCGALVMVATAGYYHYSVNQPDPHAQSGAMPTGQGMPSQMPEGTMNMSMLFGNEEIDPALAQRAGELMQAMQANPNDAQVAIDLALLFLEAEDYIAMLNFATRASTLEPTNATAAYLKGVAHSQLGEYTDAIAEFNRSLELNENPATHYGLAILYKYNANDLVMAKSHLDKALQAPNLSDDLRNRILAELEGM